MSTDLTDDLEDLEAIAKSTRPDHLVATRKGISPKSREHQMRLRAMARGRAKGIRARQGMGNRKSPKVTLAKSAEPK